MANYFITDVGLLLLQTYTALADTPGTKFSTECEALLASGDYSKLLEQFVSQLTLIFDKVPDKGALQPAN